MFILQSAVVKGRGGIEAAVQHYERMFRAVGVRSTVLYRGPSLDALRDRGADVIEAPEILTSPLAGVLPLLGDLGDRVAERSQGQPIIAIVHSDRTLPGLKRIAPRARFVTPCHSDKFKHKTRADLVVTLNADQDAAARKALPDVRVAQLGNPYIAEQRGVLPPSADPPRFNFVARFIATKDPMALVNAAALLPSPPALRFFGDGELSDDTRALAAARGLNAEFAGWDSQPFARFHRNDVLVLPSRWEGLPYLLQEALDHGVPTIASDIAGNRTALGDGAFGALYPLGDAAALANAMSAAGADLDALRAKAEKGRLALGERYGGLPFWRAMLAELEGPGVSRHA